jgi:hypothetical protein
MANGSDIRVPPSLAISGHPLRRCPATDARQDRSTQGDPMNPDDLRRLFERHNWRFHKCLEPRMACEEKSIRAHSIQNAHVMDLIATNGHVVMLRARLSESGPVIDFENVGRNQASTFTGLCNEHDTTLFAPLDTKPLDVNDREQLFLLAYRSVTRELHAVMEGASKIQAAYMSRVERGLDPKDEASDAGILATGHLLKSFLAWKYREDHFDRALLSRQYDAIEHDVITLANQSPCIAVSSLFSIDEIQRDDDVVRCVLNVLPIDNSRTLAIFSYIKDDRVKAKAALDRILSSGAAYQKYELSKLILTRIENFLLSPTHFESWTPVKAAAIRETFVRTILHEPNAAECADLMLF